jgi:tetratricopeptide (TPR) repeat protein
MLRWEHLRRPAPTAEWARARDALREAHALDPHQPNYVESIGRLYHLRALPLPTSEPLARDYAAQALEYYRQSLARRPGSPYAWANVAQMKGRMGDLDAEFDAALGHADALGPWEPDVQLAVADAGFSNWAKLKDASRAAVRSSAGRALLWPEQSPRLFALARRTGRLDVVCALPGVARTPQASACI